MNCLIGCLALLTPRIVLVVLVLVSDYVGAAYDTVLWPLLGFFFLPITTLAYAAAENELRHGSLLWWGLVVVAVAADLGFLGSGSWGVRGLRGRKGRRR